MSEVEHPEILIYMTVRRWFLTAAITYQEQRMRNSLYKHIYKDICANILPYKNTSFYMSEIEHRNINLHDGKKAASDICDYMSRRTYTELSLYTYM
jgi:hypothetical protein